MACEYTQYMNVYNMDFHDLNCMYLSPWKIHNANEHPPNNISVKSFL